MKQEIALWVFGSIITVALFIIGHWISSKAKREEIEKARFEKAIDLMSNKIEKIFDSLTADIHEINKNIQDLMIQNNTNSVTINNLCNEVNNIKHIK